MVPAPTICFSPACCCRVLAMAGSGGASSDADQVEVVAMAHSASTSTDNHSPLSSPQRTPGGFHQSAFLLTDYDEHGTEERRTTSGRILRRIRRQQIGLKGVLIISAGGCLLLVLCTFIFAQGLTLHKLLRGLIEPTRSGSHELPPPP